MDIPRSEESIQKGGKSSWCMYEEEEEEEEEEESGVVCE